MPANRVGGRASFFKPSPFGTVTTKPVVSDDEDDDDEFFSRSKQTYAILAAEKAERKKRKAEREQGTDLEDQTADAPSSEKKPRTIAFSAPEASPQPHLVDSNVPIQFPESSRGLGQGRVASEKEYLFGEDSQKSGAGPLESEPPIIELDEAEDNSFGEVRDGKSMEAGGSPSPPDTLLPSDPEPHPANTKGKATSNIATSSFEVETSHAQAPSVLKPAALILITSPMEGTSALKVQRRLDQRLKEARLEWCNRQGFDKGQTNEIVLTCRGKLLYDSTSCEALGIKVDDAGRLVHDISIELSDDPDVHLHVEAMTRTILKERKEVKSEPATARYDEPSTGARQSEAPTEPRIRLTLKSKNYKDVKLVVGESQGIQRLMDVFQNSNDIAETSTLSIHFDGEELDPASTVASYDVGDLDTLDVYIKA